MKVKTKNIADVDWMLKYDSNHKQSLHQYLRTSNSGVALTSRNGPQCHKVLLR